MKLLVYLACEEIKMNNAKCQAELLLLKYIRNSQYYVKDFVMIL